ncbi:MAG: hypothetical protein B7Z39_01490 [Novosphingobium sp. 12-64-8]|nr:MAG: hypothetical protein B7Z39_01490 [Novosphingobium sp. 12-64-8]
MALFDQFADADPQLPCGCDNLGGGDTGAFACRLGCGNGGRAGGAAPDRIDQRFGKSREAAKFIDIECKLHRAVLGHDVEKADGKLQLFLRDLLMFIEDRKDHVLQGLGDDRQKIFGA